MPELPEVETVCRQLNEALRGQVVRRVTVRDQKLDFAIFDDLIEGMRVEYVTRYGKQVVFALKPRRSRYPDHFLVVHLRMTGRLHVTAKNDPIEESGVQPRFSIELDYDTVHFRDTRRFGTAFLTMMDEEFEPKGLDPTLPEFNWRRLKKLINGSTTPVKNWLLRQDRLVGIGNIYASEICFKAGLHPLTPAGKISDAGLKEIAKATRSILKAAIRHCGTTFSDFQDTTGSTGGYVKYLKVYGREGEPCKTCKTAIERITQAQRSTFFCPACQPYG